MKNNATYMGQPANRGEIKIQPTYPNEGFATIKCGGTSVEIGYTMLHFFAGSALAWAPKGENHPDYPKWAAIRDALHSIVCEAAEGGTSENWFREAQRIITYRIGEWRQRNENPETLPGMTDAEVKAYYLGRQREAEAMIDLLSAIDRGQDTTWAAPASHKNP